VEIEKYILHPKKNVQFDNRVSISGSHRNLLEIPTPKSRKKKEKCILAIRNRKCAICVGKGKKKIYIYIYYLESIAGEILRSIVQSGSLAI
jgi:hypothetical protein